MLACRNRETPNTAQERVSAGLVPFFFFLFFRLNYCVRRQVRRLSQQLEPCWEGKRIKSASNWCIWVPKKDGFLSCCERGMSPKRESNLSPSNSALRRTTTEPQQDRKYQLVRGLQLVKQSEIVNVERHNSSEGLFKGSFDPTQTSPFFLLLNWLSRRLLAGFIFLTARLEQPKTLSEFGHCCDHIWHAFRQYLSFSIETNDSE